MIMSLKTEKKIFQECKKLIWMSLSTSLYIYRWQTRMKWTCSWRCNLKVRWRKKLGIIGLRHRFSLPKRFLWMCLGYVVLDAKKKKKSFRLKAKRCPVIYWMHVLFICPIFSKRPGKERTINKCVRSTTEQFIDISCNTYPFRWFEHPCLIFFHHMQNSYFHFHQGNYSELQIRITNYLFDIPGWMSPRHLKLDQHYPNQTL